MLYCNKLELEMQKLHADVQKKATAKRLALYNSNYNCMNTISKEHIEEEFHFHPVTGYNV